MSIFKCKQNPELLGFILYNVGFIYGETRIKSSIYTIHLSVN